VPRRSIAFGYYPRKCDFDTGAISITSNNDLGKLVEGIEHHPNVYKGWIYPPPQQMIDFVSGQIVDLPHSPRVFGLPKTHTLTHVEAQSDEHLDFLVWCIGFFTGMRLTSTAAGYLDATPICPGKLTDFTPLTRELADAVSLADNFWKQHSSHQRNIKRLSGIIHVLFLSEYPHALCFERFNYLYIALDACFALTTELRGLTGKKPSHARRIAWMCNEFQMPVPNWASPTTTGSEISLVRNDSIHESLFFEEPLGFAIYGTHAPAPNRLNVTLEMQALVCRLIVALLGRPNCAYVKSVVTSRQMHGLYT
jgi:hypothetical protein